MGQGYSPAFIENLRRCIAGLGAETPVTVVAEPDAICGACPHLAEDGCRLHGAGTERGIVSQDLQVARRLGIEPGETLSWSAVLERIRERIAPGDLEEICGRCPWLPLGHCRAGLARLRRPPA